MRSISFFFIPSPQKLTYSTKLFTQSSKIDAEYKTFYVGYTFM